MKRNLILIILLIAPFASSFGCECAFGASLKKRISTTDYIAMGTVVQIEYILVPDKRGESIKSFQSFNYQNISEGKWLTKVTLQISKVLKGKKRRKIRKVYTGIGDFDCGFNFVTGEKYILFGHTNDSETRALREYKNRYKNAISTSICAGTKEFEESYIKEILSIVN